MTHPEYAGLLRAILESPDDDTPRLVMADWLDERGDGGRAEFIRLQCRIAAIEAVCSCGRCVRRRGGGQHTNGPCGVDQERDELPGGRSKQAFLRRREKELLAPYAEAWAVAGLDGERWGAAADAKGVSLHHWEDLQHGPIASVDVAFRRGFVDSITLSLADFEAHAKAAFAAHPVVKMTLSDALIHPSGGNNTYFVGGLGRFPKEYWDGLQNLPTRQAALDALSRAAVAVGRERAGLPPLAGPA